ncbi:hypothetical protein [uncultured Duncaniella sp.]|uniref:hypothetical protein n=3 Tax=uncultured Duncaniella sp. TaxID=2768039 RepID=UPI00261F11F0|nr:hypothetical protein [uncultured Duncaniella sp.]
MKKLLSLILVMMAFAFLASAEESNSTSIPLVLEASTIDNNSSPKVHRAPMRINIEAWYNSDSNTIDIIYDGENEGEVVLYLSDNIVGYDSTINTTLSLPTSHGAYRIEIVTDNWTAEGLLKL